MEQGAAIDSELRGLRFGCKNPPSVPALARRLDLFFPVFRHLVLFMLRRGRMLRLRRSTSPPLPSPV